MTNILIALNHWDATQFESDHWATASWFFGPRHKFLHAIATIAVIQPNPEKDVNDVETIIETAHRLIGKRIDDEDERYPPPDLTDDQRDEVVRYLLDCNRAMRPYLPCSGTMQLHAHVSSPDFDELYLIIKHYGDNEYPNPIKPGTSIRSSNMRC